MSTIQANNVVILEQQIISLAMSKGHENPRECQKHQDCLYANGADRKIIGYDLIPHSDLILKNIRHEDVDMNYCRTEIQPQITIHLAAHGASKGLRYPILVVQRGKKYEIVNGHGRRWSLEDLGISLVPAFIIEDKGTPYQKYAAKVKVNARGKGDGRRFKEKDVILQLHDLRKMGFFSNLSCEKTTKKEVNDYMDNTIPYELTHSTNRGRIFNDFYNNITAKVKPVITWDDKERDSCLARNGYPSIYATGGNSKKPVPMKFPHFVCHKKKAIILIGTDNDATFETSFHKFERLWLHNANYRKAHQGYHINMIYLIRKVPITITELDVARDSCYSKLNETNAVLVKLGAPTIKTVVFPKQLRSEKGDRVITVNKKGKFV